MIFINFAIISLFELQKFWLDLFFSTIQRLLKQHKTETLHHSLCLCSHSRLFWSNFEYYWPSLTNDKIQLSLQDVVVGIISSQNSSLVNLLNYFIIIGKLYLWDCRRDHMHPDLQRFKVRLKFKYEIERFISLKNKNSNYFFFKKNGSFHLICYSTKYICIYIFFLRNVIWFPFSVLILFE